MSKPFFIYSHKINSNLPYDGMILSADGKDLKPDLRCTVLHGPGVLGLDRAMTYVGIARGEADCGCLEFLPDYSADNRIHWQAVNGLVCIRVQNTILTLDLTHISKPPCPQHCRPTDFEPVE